MRQQLAKNPHRENKKSISDPVPEDKSVADPKEALSLYAEFAMDFATLSVQQALMAALNALDIQEHLPTKEEHL